MNYERLFRGDTRGGGKMDGEMEMLPAQIEDLERQRCCVRCTMGRFITSTRTASQGRPGQVVAWKLRGNSESSLGPLQFDREEAKFLDIYFYETRARFDGS